MTIEYDTPVLYTDDNRTHRIGFWQGRGVAPAKGGEITPVDESSVVALVPVPDGVAYEDALRAVEDARPWVPLPDGPTESHREKRLRVVWAEGSHIEDFLLDFAHGSATFLGVPGIWTRDSGEWFIHPDDVPDPDADLIEAMAERIQNAQNAELYSELYDEYKERARRQARAALAVVRERGAL